MQLIPNVLERTGNSERSYDLFSRMLKDRIIFVKGEVNDDMASIVSSSLLFLRAEDPKKDIQMYINSPGGSVIAGLEIVDCMNYVAGNGDLSISTTVMGQAASMGSIIASSGTVGKRYILPNARHLMHCVSSGTQGTAIDMKIAMAETERLNELLLNIYVTNTGHSYDKILADMSRDFFLSATQSVEYGLADSVLLK